MSNAKQEVTRILDGMEATEQANLLYELITEVLPKLPKREEEAKEEEPQKHYYCSSKSMEECDAEAAAYEETPGGRIFKRRLENALDFVEKAHSCNITCVQVGYLADKCYNSFLNGSFELYALGFKSGAEYQKRKAKARAKK